MLKRVFFVILSLVVLAGLESSLGSTVAAPALFVEEPTSSTEGADDVEATVKVDSLANQATNQSEQIAVTAKLPQQISKFDTLMKRIGEESGYDWRFMSAIAYCESRFKEGLVSKRGAAGLMQVMPRTAEYYGVNDLLDPEENIKAGTSHLKRLQRLYINGGFEHSELIKFTLASYNAGEGRIADCRNFAESRNIDSRNWNEIVSLIPQMREDSILEEESVKLGKFQGHETIAYIDSIMSLYEAFCKICPRG